MKQNNDALYEINPALFLASSEAMCDIQNFKPTCSSTVLCVRFLCYL